MSRINTNHVPSGFIGAPALIRDDSCHSWFHRLTALLKISRRQLYKWRMQGLIPSFKLGRAVRFRLSEVAAALERHRAG
jgi:excisionase family DNA binding protein